MMTERGPGFERQVAWGTESEHLRAIAQADRRYLIGRWPDQADAGFALLEGLGDPHEGVKLRRIAVNAPGQGFGRPFLASVIDWVFESTSAPRLWLDVFIDNDRARRVYRSVGLSEDGCLRQAYLRPGGDRVDRILMSILRGEWKT